MDLHLALELKYKIRIKDYLTQEISGASEFTMPLDIFLDAVVKWNFL
jgi:hypothetical protein